MQPMSATRWDQVESLFHEALDLPGPQRNDYVQRRSAGDPKLAEQVGKMLAAMDRQTDTLDRGVALSQRGQTPPAEDDLPLSPNDLVGSYRVLRAIGRGGMGDVYLAERADGQFEQRVALKVMRTRTEAHLERFHAERRILARLEHPGIARLIDGGLLDDGRPYMVMEYVSGQPIARYCEQYHLNLEQRLELFEQVCQAVEFAHSNLIVHRDLKSGNILVGKDGHIKLLDFGVAKLLSEHWTGDDETTRGTPLTPDHAAPEQLSGGAITTATDVYALGVVLYVLLTGRSPWAHLREQPVSMALRTILNEEPPSLPEAAESQANAPVHSKLLQGDLAAIVARALRKSPADRYRTVEALCDDLGRYREHKPVQARAGSHGYRIGRFMHRNRWPLLAAVTLALLLTGFTLRLAVETRRAQNAELQALTDARTAQAVTDYLVSLFESASPRHTGGAPINPKLLVDSGLDRVENHLQERPEVRTRMLATLSRLYSEMGYEAEALQTAQAAVHSADQAQRNPLAYGEALLRRASAEEKSGQYQQARQTAVAAENELKKVLPLDDPRLLRALEVQGLSLVNRDQVAEAIELITPILERPEVREQTLAHAQLLSVLAAAHTLNGDGARAIPMQEHVIRVFRDRYGADHLLSVDALSVLAHIEYYAGRYQDSMTHMQEALEKAERHYTPGTAELLNMQRGLANAYGELGRIREAIRIEHQIVEAHKAVSGDNPTLGISYTNLAADLNHFGDYEAAAQAALSAQRYLDFEAEPVERVRANLMLGRAMLRMGHAELAVDEMRADVPERFGGMLGDGYRGLRRQLLGEAELSRGNLDVAAEHFRVAREVLEASQPATARILILLDVFDARLLRARGDLTEAAALLENALQRLHAARGRFTPDSLEVEAEFLSVLAQQGQLAPVHQQLPDLRQRIHERLADTARARKLIDALEAQLPTAAKKLEAQMSGIALVIR